MEQSRLSPVMSQRCQLLSGLAIGQESSERRGQPYFEVLCRRPELARRDPPRIAPLVSVLTPSYNQATWLQDNLQSVRNQAYPAIEHIVMDGASTDGSQELLAAAGGNVIWQSKPDAGQSDALNHAFRRSSGEIIGWINSDDAYFATDVVSRAVEVFQLEPGVAVVYGHAALVGPSGKFLHVMWAPEHNMSLLRRHNYIVQPTVFIRREVLEAAFVNESFDYMMDRELWLRLSASYRFKRIDRILAVDRHHAERKSYTRLDIARVDDAVLSRTYGLERGHRATVAKKMRKAMFRIRGVTRLREVIDAELAFEGTRDCLPWLAARQLIIPRRFMNGTR